HSINIIVDNARTLNAKEFPLEGFGMKPGTRYPINQIQYMDEHGKQKIVDCYFTGGANKGKPKGLLILAEELKIKVPANIKLEELKRLLSLHKAFQNVSKLEKVAGQYGIAITFSPKFHCCGMHKDSILATISLDQRCTCRSIKQSSPSQRYQQTSSNFTYFTGSSRYP
ncbi:unnamed protein product, partial [Rotaria sordida]